MHENRPSSLEKQLSDWKKEHQPGLKQFTFTIVLIIFAFIQTDMLEVIESTPYKILAVIGTVAICSFFVYLLRIWFTPNHITDMETEINQLKELEYKAFLFNE